MLTFKRSVIAATSLVTFAFATAVLAAPQPAADQASLELATEVPKGPYIQFPRLPK